MKQIVLAHINSYYLSNKLHEELVATIATTDALLEQIVYVPLINVDKDAESSTKRKANVQVVLSACFSKLTRSVWPLKILQIYQDYKARFRGLNINITHSHSLISNGIISYLRYRKYKTPYIITVRNTDINIFLKKSAIFRKLGGKILNHASSIVVLSPAYRDQQLKKYIDSSLFSNLLPKIHVIPNAVNDFWLENSPLQQKVIGDTIEIIFVGKLRPNKNLKAVISACNILHSRGKKVRLTICGDGELKEQLLGQVYEFEFNYLGFINDKEELRKIYNKAHILIVPSFMESFGLVYVEAMSQGLGVIYTKGQGFDGYFEDGIVGYATDPNDHEGIACMVEKISDNFHQISTNAIREAQEFSWNNTALKLVKLYRQAI